jgi:hypothetical protein
LSSGADKVPDRLTIDDLNESGISCGEGCGRPAVVGFTELTYCGECLARLAHLGSVFADAADSAARELAESRAIGEKVRARADHA